MMSHSFGDPLHRKPHRGEEKRYQTPIRIFARNSQKKQTCDHQRYESGRTCRNAVIIRVGVAFDCFRIYRHKARKRRENNACRVGHRADNGKLTFGIERQRNNRLGLPCRSLGHKSFGLPHRFFVYADRQIHSCRFKYQITVFAVCGNDCFKPKPVACFRWYGIVKLGERIILSDFDGSLPVYILYRCIKLSEILQKPYHSDAKDRKQCRAYPP